MNGNLTDGPELAPGVPAVWFKGDIDDQAVCTFAYSLDGNTFVPIGGTFAFGWHNYRGTRIGICCYNDNAEAGWIDVDWFHYNYLGVGAGNK